MSPDHATAPRNAATSARTPEVSGPAETVPGAPSGRWSGSDLIAALSAGMDALHQHRDAINALNVFPVPDGDTGTNLDLTVSAAMKDVATLGNQPDVGANEVAARLARGSLLGARGNSGVILSQIFRGLADGIGTHSTVGGRDIARALASASETAYRALVNPVEGTMLTVIRVASEGAETAAIPGASIADVLDAAVIAAREALANTPNQLDILRQAGVVDAGGQGVVSFLSGMANFAAGRGVAVPEPAGTPHPAVMLDAGGHDHDTWGYCTNFMVTGDAIDVDAARDHLGTMGTSTVIVGDDTTLKVHIHTDHPGAILEYAVTLGELSEIRIDNMTLQTRAVREAAGATEATGAPDSAPAAPIGTQAILAVASGDGLAAALRSMGAAGIVPGGATMNPSTRDLLRAVEATDAAEVLLLPNHPNVIMAALQVQQLTERAIRVIPTRSVPQGIAALSAFNAQADLDTNARAMTRAIADVQTIQLTFAARDATVNGVDVKNGQTMVLLDGDLVAASSSPGHLLATTLADDRFGGTELVTIYPGEHVSDDETRRIVEHIERALPDAEIEVHPGGQPLYTFVISLE